MSLRVLGLQAGPRMKSTADAPNPTPGQVKSQAEYHQQGFLSEHAGLQWRLLKIKGSQFPGLYTYLYTDTHRDIHIYIYTYIYMVHPPPPTIQLECVCYVKTMVFMHIFDGRVLAYFISFLDFSFLDGFSFI